MKVGVSAFAWTGSLEDRHLDLLPMLRERGLDGFEIPMRDPKAINIDGWRRAFESSGLDCTVCALLPPDINPISRDAGSRKRAISHLRSCVETSAELGSHLIAGPVFAPTGYLPSGDRPQEEWKWAVECFSELGETLDSHDITLSIEPVNRSETSFLNTASEASRLCKAVGHPRIGVTLDTFHANIEEEDTALAVSSLGKLLKHVHMSEDDRGMLGSGHVNFAGIVAALRQIEYQGYMMIEGFGYSPEEPDSLAMLAEHTPEEIAFSGASHLRNILCRS